jgi:hypothetical protein
MSTSLSPHSQSCDSCFFLNHSIAEWRSSCSSWQQCARARRRRQQRSGAGEAAAASRLGSCEATASGARARRRRRSGEAVAHGTDSSVVADGHACGKRCRGRYSVPSHLGVCCSKQLRTGGFTAHRCSCRYLICSV